MEEILLRLREKNLRPTPQRQAVLRVLLEAGRPLRAEEVLQRVRVEQPGVSLDTVYRALAAFKRTGLANELVFRDGCRRWEPSLSGEHRHYLICLGCGSTREVPCCPEDSLARARECYPDFEIADHSFVVYGYCAPCREGRRQ